MASISAGVTAVGTVKRYLQKKNVMVNLPYCVAEYNTDLSETDLMNECIANYRVGIRSKKW